MAATHSNLTHVICPHDDRKSYGPNLNISTAQFKNGSNTTILVSTKGRREAMEDALLTCIIPEFKLLKHEDRIAVLEEFVAELAKSASQKKYEEQGSTLCGTIRWREGKAIETYTFSVGDSSSLLFHQNEKGELKSPPTVLSGTPHSPDPKIARKEYDRIKENHEKKTGECELICNEMGIWAVQKKGDIGGLCMTRSLGDSHFKKAGVNSKPTILHKKFELAEGEVITNVVACDGLQETLVGTAVFNELFRNKASACDVYLDALPSNHRYKSSDALCLHLYKKPDDVIFYYSSADKKKYYLNGLKITAPFTSVKGNRINCEDQKIIAEVLAIASKQHRCYQHIKDDQDRLHAINPKADITALDLKDIGEIIVATRAQTSEKAAEALLAAAFYGDGKQVQAAAKFHRQHESDLKKKGDPNYFWCSGDNISLGFTRMSLDASEIPEATMVFDGHGKKPGELHTLAIDMGNHAYFILQHCIRRKLQPVPIQSVSTTTAIHQALNIDRHTCSTDNSSDDDRTHDSADDTTDSEASFESDDDLVIARPTPTSQPAPRS